MHNHVINPMIKFILIKILFSYVSWAQNTKLNYFSSISKSCKFSSVTFPSKEISKQWKLVKESKVQFSVYLETALKGYVLVCFKGTGMLCIQEEVEMDGRRGSRKGGWRRWQWRPGRSPASWWPSEGSGWRRSGLKALKASSEASLDFLGTWSSEVN